MNSVIFMDVAGAAGSSGLSLFTLVYVVGFIAAVIGGSLAWYNSKRPPGWEDAERPDIIPDLKTDNPDSQSDDKTQS
ncbi:MAG: photosystem II assembly protein Psb35 [Cyanobacteriota bacterium]|jgi:hypothetical protein|nr:MAG: hypothetical protein EYR95_00230 [Phormidium sp. SL48-SHIP]